MSKKTSLYVLTDTHYLSPEMWEECDCINDREKGDQIAIKYTPQILRSFFRKIIADEHSQYVLITGDLINNGDLQSHLDFQKELKMLTDAGKKVLVTCATHDYAGLGDDENIFHPVRYTKNGTVPAQRVYKTELPQLYAGFGHDFADSVHVESGSYSLMLSEKLRVIMIYDNGNGRSHCGLFEDGFMWLENEISRAKGRGETVFLAVHHPVVPPWNIYKNVAEFEMFGGYKRLSELMCRYGVRLIFTGHTHVHGIKKYTDDKGEYFYDVTTSALPSAKGRMRKVVFDTEKNTCSIESIGIDAIDNLDTGGLSAEEYIYSLNFTGLIEKSLPLMKTDWDAFVHNVSRVANADILKKHPHISKAVINKLTKMKMSFPARIGKKESGITKEEISYLKSILLADTLFNIGRSVFAGNGPYPPETPEHKAIIGFLKKAQKILRLFGKDINKLIPGDETVLEIVRPFLYNTRTGDDNRILIDMEK